MPLIELLPPIFVPAFDLTVNYVPLPPPIASSVMDITVSLYLEPPGEFTIRLNDPKLDLINQQGGLLAEGARVEISLGYVGQTQRVMVGEVVALTADFPNSGPATLHVEGYDLLHAATRGTAYRRFDGPTPDSGLPDSQIVSQIASEIGLVPSVDPTPPRTEAWVQDHVSNLTFLRTIAQASGFYLWVDGDTLYFKQNPPAPNHIPLKWGQNLVSFSPRLSTAGQVNAIEVRGWDPSQKQSISARAQRTDTSLSPTGEQQVSRGAGGRSERIVPRDLGITSVQEAQARADRLLADQGQGAIRGSGTAVGQADMVVGTILELSGIGRFSGDYQVEQVSHTYGGSGYQSSFQVRKQA
ncbi:MAG TPA: hypothetical protein VFA33_23475 [Bryobacteraceae bacterium]|nr:hypothetical protein [Bryobacteraceae bacterium]